MTCNNCKSTTLWSSVVNSNCPDTSGCPAGVCPDLVLKRHDTKPSFKVSVSDCEGPMDLEGTNIVVEVNIWAKAKLKKAITDSDLSFSFADNIGFNQVMENDIIIMDSVRAPEQMLVTGFDEVNKTISVTRGYNGTTARAWSKGSILRIFRAINASASIEIVKEDITNVDGTQDTNVLTGTYLVYDWQGTDTCLPGCYWLEFRVFQLGETPTDNNEQQQTQFVQGWEKGWLEGINVGEVESITTNYDAWVLQKEREYEKWKNEALTEMTLLPSEIVIPSEISYISTDIHQCNPQGVLWSRKFPSSGNEGFLIQITDSPSVF